MMQLSIMKDMILRILITITLYDERYDSWNINY